MKRRRDLDGRSRHAPAERGRLSVLVAVSCSDEQRDRFLEAILVYSLLRAVFSLGFCPNLTLWHLFRFLGLLELKG